MSKQRLFEIVDRPNGRFGWIFVRREEGGRRRVLARSTRDFSSLEKVVGAIDRMREAEIDPTGVGPEPFDLPATSFQVVAGVVPLRVDEFPVFEQAGFTTQQAPVSRAKAKPKRAAKSKAKPRRTRARSTS